MEALAAAHALIEQYFPECSTAFLAGSVIRGESTATSDLDIVIITNREGTPYRESFREFGWPIEAFVNNMTSYRDFFANDIRGRRPMLPTMCAEGIILRDSEGLAQSIKDEACMLLDQGPEPLSPSEVVNIRYRITDMLDDFIGSEKFGESFFIASNVAVAASSLILGYHKRWIGYGKSVLRELNKFDPHLAMQLQRAVEVFCSQGVKDDLIQFADEALNLVGGRLFEGYLQRKTDV
jgi:hypothetical protein